MSDVIIYGAGNSFKEYLGDPDFVRLGILENKINIIGICDRDREKWGREIIIGNKRYIIRDILCFENIPVNFVLITSRQYYDEMSSDLLEKGIDNTKIYLLDEYIRYKFFEEKTFKYKLSLVLMIRNEAEYILEWIEYHRIIGIEHFYVYDDESSDDLYKVIERYIQEGIITYIPWFGADQIGAYNHAVHNFKWDNKYMGFIDSDEFFVSVEHKNIVSVLEEIVESYEKNPLRMKYLPHCGGIGINWRMYGTSYHREHQKGLVIENYMYRADDVYYENVHIKSIVNPRTIVACAVHKMHYVNGFQCISENGSAILDSFFFDSKCNRLRINHYYSKSEDDLLKKYCRGWAPEREDKLDISMSALRMESYRKRLEQIKREWNKNYDPIMKQYIPLVKKKLGYP